MCSGKKTNEMCWFEEGRTCLNNAEIKAFFKVVSLFLPDLCVILKISLFKNGSQADQSSLTKQNTYTLVKSCC